MTLNQKLTVLALCGNTFFNHTKGYSAVEDELCDIIHDLRKEYRSDKEFKQVVDSNDHLLCAKMKNFLDEKYDQCA